MTQSQVMGEIHNFFNGSHVNTHLMAFTTNLHMLGSLNLTTQPLFLANVLTNPLICSKVSPTKVFWIRCLPRNLTYLCTSIIVPRCVWPWTKTITQILMFFFPGPYYPLGGNRDYEPGEYVQQRERLMAILPQSQQELPPRRCYICPF